MLLTDLKGTSSVQPRRTGLGSISPLLRLPPGFTSSAILILSCITFGAAVSRAQDQQEQSVAEAARQARAEKQEAPKPLKHVYTEEDFKHPNILTPEDRARIEAKRNECSQQNNCSPAPAQNEPSALDANSETPATSLGEVARQLRKQKGLQALKPKQSEPFHLPFSTPALASPILPERPAIRPPTPPALRPETRSQVSRRDPFARVLVRPAPPRPEVRGSEVSSSLAQPARPILPTHPKVFVRPTPPTFSVRLAHPTILSTPAEPVAPVEIVRPVQPAHTLSPAPVPDKKIVSVQPGDSLWRLAQQNLGSGSRWPELLTVNSWIAKPNQIRTGAKLVIPAISATSTSARGTRNSSPLTLKIRKGDTLWSLAKANLGHSSAWPCLAAANPVITNPDRIFEGQQLHLPSSCTAIPHSSASPANP